jgi:hypothetical protein
MGDSFADFLERLPGSMVQHQLHLFSRLGDVDEAIGNIASCSHVMVMEEFAAGLDQLKAKLDLRLPNVSGVRKAASAFEPTEPDLQAARPMVVAERELVRWARTRPRP